VNVVLVLLGALVLALGLVSARISQSPFPPSLPAFGASIAIGPHVLGWVDNAELGSRPRMVEVAARITLGIGMVGPKGSVRRVTDRHLCRRVSRVNRVRIALPLGESLRTSYLSHTRSGPACRSVPEPSIRWAFGV
jgi:hypothetical protein